MKKILSLLVNAMCFGERLVIKKNMLWLYCTMFFLSILSLLFIILIQ